VFEDPHGAVRWFIEGISASMEIYGKSRYVTVGILPIVANGRVVARWEIEDPRGLQRLMKIVKKQMRKKAKAESGRNR